MMTCLRRGLSAALLAALASGAAAQDPPELPEEAAERAALGRAQGKVDEALRAFEAYGRGAPVTDERAREVAYDRLTAPVEPAPPGESRTLERIRSGAAHHELVRFRRAILARLHALAPDQHPLRHEPAPRPPGPVAVRVIDVQDLVFAPEDHVAPNTGLGAGLDASGAYDGEGSDTAVGLDADALMELLEREVELGDGESLEMSSGRLVVRLRASTLARVNALLAKLRKDRGGLVDLEVRVYRVQAATFARLRDQACALTDDGERALASGDGASLLASHHVLAHDGQRVHVWRGRSRSYVADIDVNETGVVPVQEPQVAVINEGLVVEARPIVDRARGRVLVDVSLSLTRLDPAVDVQKVENLELEVPHLRIARTTASASVPLGRGALLGGALDAGAGAGDDLTCVVYVRPRLTDPDRRKR